MFLYCFSKNMHFLNWFKLLQDCIRAEKERSFQLQPTPGTYLFLALTPAAAQPASCIGEIDWLTRSVFYFGRFKTSFRWHSWSSLPHSHIIINACKSRGRVPFLGTAATATFGSNQHLTLSLGHPGHIHLSLSITLT